MAGCKWTHGNIRDGLRLVAPWKLQGGMFNPEKDDVLPGPTGTVVLTPYVKEKAPGGNVNKMV